MLLNRFLRHSPAVQIAGNYLAHAFPNGEKKNLPQARTQTTAFRAFASLSQFSQRILVPGFHLLGRGLLSLLKPSFSYADAPKSKLSDNQERLVQKIRKGRLEDPAKEIKRLEDLGLLTEKEKAQLARMFPQKEQLLAKSIYAQALALKSVLGTTHYVFVHGQEVSRSIFSDAVKELVKEKSPETDVRQYKFLRSPKTLIENPHEIGLYQNGFTYDHEDLTKQDLLSSDGFLFNDQHNESAYSWFTRNANMTDKKAVLDYLLYAVQEFYPALPPGFIAMILEQNPLSLPPKEVPCGNLIVLCIPKNVEGAYYRSHWLGKRCYCHPEPQEREILEKLQRGEMDASLQCKFGAKNPQYRLFLPKFRSEESLIYRLSPFAKEDRKFIKQQIRPVIEQLNQSEELLRKQLQSLFIAKHFPESVHLDPLLLWKSREFVSFAIDKQGLSALSLADSALRKDRALLFKALETDKWSLKYADLALRKDREFVLAAIKHNGLMLRYADPSLRKDREIVLAAIKQGGFAFEYADVSLKKDREFVLKVVTQNGWALRYVHPSLRANRKVVLAAVKQNFDALRYTTLKLQEEINAYKAAHGNNWFKFF